jgi:hypothetical protein
MNSSSNAVYVYNALVGLVGDVILNFVAGSNINTSYNNKRVDTVTDVTGRYWYGKTTEYYKSQDTSVDMVTRLRIGRQMFESVHGQEVFLSPKPSDFLWDSSGYRGFLPREQSDQSVKL